MATSLIESRGIELKNVFSCVWCKKPQLTQLVQFRCFHLSCKVCLQSKLEDPSPGTAFNCPECDMSCMVPTGGVDTFPDEPLQHKLSQITRDITTFICNKPNCKLCEQADSWISHFCITCRKYLCERDAKQHQWKKHTVITFEEVTKEANIVLMMKSQVKKCQEHSLEKTYFCKKCQQLICTECGMLNHSDHKKDSVKNIATEYREIIETKLKEIVNKLEYRKGAESYIKVFLKFSSDLDVVEKYKEILSNLKICEMIERRRPSGFELERKWKEDDLWPGLSVCEEELVVVKGQTIKWYAMGGECKRTHTSVDLGDATRVEVCEGEVYISDEKKRAVLVFDRYGEMKRKLPLPEREAGVSWFYNILGLALDMINKDIYVSSTRTNTVYKCDTGRGTFIPWITDGLNSPRYLCVSPDHHLVVSNYHSHKVNKYNPQGDFVWSYGSDTGQLAHPYGVTSDPFGDIFIADYSHDRIYVVSSNGELLFYVSQGLKNPTAVSFGNGKLVVITDIYKYDAGGGPMSVPKTMTTPSHIYVMKGKYS